MSNNEDNGIIIWGMLPFVCLITMATFLLLKETKSILIFILALITLCVPFWVVFIRLLKPYIQARRISKKGKEYSATFIDSEPVVKDDAVPIELQQYRIKYCWIDDYGKTITDFTDYVYNYKDIQLFEKAKGFVIKTSGKKGAAIIDMNQFYK